MLLLSITDEEESDLLSELMVTKTFDRVSSFRTKLKRSSAFTTYSLLLIDDRLKLNTSHLESSVWREGGEREREGEKEREICE
jgi:hypothetical protein